ncbi:MAG: hypothetical protein KC493_07920 [Bacteriovoracaceae bacterium]|nr:hypothetical protein [Bacteriovoracaceae bacterium]
MKKVALLSTMLLIILVGVKYFNNSTPAPKEVIKAPPVQTPIVKATPRPKFTPKKRSIKTPVVTTINNTKKAKQALSDPEAFIPMDDDYGILIGHAMVYEKDEVIVAHGDVIVAELKDLERIQEEGKPLVLQSAKYWPDGKVSFQISPELQGTERERAIKLAMDEFIKKTPIRFVPRSPEDKEFVIFTEGSENCLSNLGMIYGGQKIYLSEGCDKGKVIHELMHTIGFLHEQNREDRDKHLTVLWQNIDEEFHLQFKKIKSRNQKIYKTGFDFTSIMLYPPEAFSVTPGDFAMVTSEGSPYPVNRHSLSTKDIQRIKIIYGAKN